MKIDKLALQNKRNKLVAITAENIDGIIKGIFIEYLYEGLESDSQEEYDEYENLFENYFRVALEKAKNDYINRKDKK